MSPKYAVSSLHTSRFQLLRYGCAIRIARRGRYTYAERFTASLTALSINSKAFRKMLTVNTYC